MDRIELSVIATFKFHFKIYDVKIWLGYCGPLALIQLEKREKWVQ